MILHQARPAERRGTTVVEMAAVIAIFCLLLFGMLEYCIMLYTMDVMQNAAREGARFAVVNSSDASLVSDTQTVVKNFMMGLDTKNTNYVCSVYLSDSSGNNIGDPTTATFGQNIGVQVSLTYKPITPGLLHLSSSFNFQTTACMASEAN